MSAQPIDYGVLEQLPAELLYLKQVAWDGWMAAQREEEALHDDNPEYSERVMTAMRQHFRGLSPHERVRRALQHRELIGRFTDQYSCDDHPETAGLYFIYGALEYAEGLFNEESAQQ